MAGVFLPTDEQRAIVEAGGRGDSFSVKAFAGTGKTSTLLLAASAIDNPTLYLAFNRSTADEALRKFPMHVTTKTAHALAFRDVGYQYKDRLEQNPWAIKAALDEHLNDSLQKFALEPRERRRFVFALIDTIGRFMQSADERITVDNVPERYHDDEVLSPEAIVMIARFAWKALSDPASSLPVTHDLYFKVWQLGRPALRWSTIFFDEAQDASPVMLDVVSNQVDAQRIYVGDSHQQIYAWRGAVDAMEALGLPTLPLTQSWRFGKAVAEHANRVLRCKQERLSVCGAPGNDDSVVVKHTGLPDVVLSRTNVGLVTDALELATSKATLAVVGGIDSMMGMIQATYDMYVSGRTRHPAFRFFQSYEELCAAADSEQGASYQPFVDIVERFKKSTPEAVAKVRAHCVDDPRQADVVLCTAHKFKGQEADVVRISGDYPEFCFFDEKLGEYVWLPDEANLAYVAITRAKKTLVLGEYDDTLRKSLAARYDMLAGVPGSRQEKLHAAL